MGLLAAIARDKREEARTLRAGDGLERLALRACRMPPCRGLAEALGSAQGIPVIAEIKRRSPSAGELRAGAVSSETAAMYESGGAAAVSVLTDLPRFGGRPEDLDLARGACSLPVLRKDFILDRAQVYQSRVAGADAVLLIAALLGREELSGLHRLARELGMAALVEVHDARELEAALDVGACLVGINNRDLGTMEVDLGVARRLAPRVPPGVTVVSESGIRCRNDMLGLLDAGVDAFLVGGALMAAADPLRLLRSLTAAG
jgi:indole-3-glycerol phosphate synthase